MDIRSDNPRKPAIVAALKRKSGCTKVTLWNLSRKRERLFFGDIV
jgi:hypothetical protein